MYHIIGSTKTEANYNKLYSKPSYFVKYSFLPQPIQASERTAVQTSDSCSFTSKTPQPLPQEMTEKEEVDNSGHGTASNKQKHSRRMNKRMKCINKKMI